MITEELKALVLDEATKLKEHATYQEKSNLDFESLSTNNIMLCIYGQMTGYCYSVRAHYLLSKCAVPYSGNLKRFNGDVSNSKFDPNEDRVFSAIEFYIDKVNSKNDVLIDYIKGDKISLTIEEL